MKLQAGSVYMTRIDGESDVMGVVIKRMWWKPWRWQLTPMYWSQPKGNAQGYVAIAEVHDGKPIKNLTLLGVVALAKLMGIEHRDFEGETK